MKKLRKVLALVLAMVMVLAMGITTSAATGTPANGTITITPPDNATGSNTYKIYKIFGATVSEDGLQVAYTLLDGFGDSNVPVGFQAKNGYIISAPSTLDESASVLADYVKVNNLTPVTSVTTTNTDSATSSSLEPGYYYITTSTGSAVYVNAGGNINIKDKNILSVVKKSAGTQYSESAKQAIAAVGSSQDFTAQITVGHGATKLEFKDTMTNMTYNGDVIVKVAGVAVASTNYTIIGNSGDSSFEVKFNSDYVKSLEDNTVITLNYSATITSDALTTYPAKNEASLKTDNDNTTKSEVKVYNATLTIDKVDENKAALVGAGFTLSKKNDDGSYTLINTINSTTENPISKFEFKGLGAGEYKFEETQVPAGYNKADDVIFTISNSDFTAQNLVISKTVENKKGATLPSTGGMGTTLFYVFGAVLVIGAGIILVTRRRMAK